jgi:outer membrane immunogenic protein
MNLRVGLIAPVQETAMKNLLLSSVALVGMTAGALAADLPARAAPPPIVPAVPAFTWSGFYVGVNAGYAWQDDGDSGVGTGAGAFDVPLLGGGIATYAIGNPNTFFGEDDNSDAFTAGAQIGYNVQLTPGSGFVFGVEADIQGLFNDDDEDEFFGGNGTTFFGVAPTALGTRAPGFGVAPPVSPVGNLALFDNAFRGNLGGSGLDWFGTLRARAGYAFDRVLVYATGGLAFAEGGDGGNGIFATNAVPLGFYVSPAAAAVGTRVTPSNFGGLGGGDDFIWGWTLGGGVEWALPVNLFNSSAVTFKIEGLYVNLDEDNNNIFGGTRVVGVSNQGAPVTRSDLGVFGEENENEFFVVRGGLNFKFNTF